MRQIRLREVPIYEETKPRTWVYVCTCRWYAYDHQGD